MPRTRPEVDRRVLGENLRYARERAGMKQQDAARQIGVGPSQLSQWENGLTLAGTDALLLLAGLYRCPVDDFLGGIDDRYDAVIERAVPLDQQHFYRARETRVRLELESRVEAFVQANIATLQRAATEATPAPTRAPKGTDSGTRSTRRAPRASKLR